MYPAEKENRSCVLDSDHGEVKNVSSSEKHRCAGVCVPGVAGGAESMRGLAGEFVGAVAVDLGVEAATRVISEKSD